MSDTENNENTPPKKKKYSCSFKDDWLKNSNHKDWIVKRSENSGFCSKCNVDFKICYDGEKAVRTHLNSDKHKRVIQAAGTSKLLDAFLTVKGF